MNLEFQASCPGKIVAFGEWAVLKGAPALGIAVKPRFYTRAVFKKKLPHSSSDIHIRLKSCWIKKPLSLKYKTDTLKIPKEWEYAFGVFRHFFSPSFLRSINIDFVEIEFECDWKPQDGLGSSSALVACVLGIKKQLRNPGSLILTERDFLEGRKLIRNLQKSRASGLDLATQLWGGQVVLQKNNVISNPLLRPLPKALGIIHTGSKFSTATKVNKLFKTLAFYKDISASTKEFLESNRRSKDWEKAIRDHNHALSRYHEIVPAPLKAFMQECLIMNYVKAIKTTGAGGGDALLCMTNSDKESTFKRFLAKKGYGFRPSSELSTKGLTVSKVNS